MSCSVDPRLSDALGEPLYDSLSFFDGITAHTAPGVLAALKLATGCEQYGTDEARFVYRYTCLSHIEACKVYGHIMAHASVLS